MSEPIGDGSDVTTVPASPDTAANGDQELEQVEPAADSPWRADDGDKVGVRYVGGDEYHGYDHADGGRPMSLMHGEAQLVSPQKARQLQEDFPGDFEIGVDVDAIKKQLAEEERSGDVPLMRRGRAELERIAREAGIDDPDDRERFPNKQKLVDAIEATR